MSSATASVAEVIHRSRAANCSSRAEQHSGSDEGGPQEGHGLVRQHRVQALVGERAAAVHERVEDHAEAGLLQSLQSGLCSVGDQDVEDRLEVGTYGAVAGERVADLLVADAAVAAAVAVQVLDCPAEPVGVEGDRVRLPAGLAEVAVLRLGRGVSVLAAADAGPADA